MARRRRVIPLFRPHLMQGWSPDFIPKLTEDAMALGLVDEVRPVRGADALRLARALATEEGILAGISGGATLAGAIEVARDLPPDAVVLCMLPDTGERYLSTPLFADITAEMTEEELALSRSTPGQRFDTPPPVAAAQPAAAVAATPEAESFVREAIADPSSPVVMFALEWCEFCWSVRRMLAHFGVACRSIDLDAVEFQAGDRGGAIRAALTALTGANTLPQVFIGGELVGGSTDLIEAWRTGRAQTLLERHGVAFDRDAAAGSAELSARVAAAALRRVEVARRVSCRCGRSRIRRRRTARRRPPGRRAATARAARRMRSVPRRVRLRLRPRF